jgi:hypothetical protein
LSLYFTTREKGVVIAEAVKAEIEVESINERGVVDYDQMVNFPEL